jgi:hypothetical protein
MVLETTLHLMYAILRFILTCDLSYCVRYPSSCCLGFSRKHFGTLNALDNGPGNRECQSWMSEYAGVASNRERRLIVPSESPVTAAVTGVCHDRSTVLRFDIKNQG